MEAVSLLVAVVCVALACFMWNLVKRSISNRPPGPLELPILGTSNFQSAEINFCNTFYITVIIRRYYKLSPGFSQSLFYKKQKLNRLFNAQFSEILA